MCTEIFDHLTRKRPHCEETKKRGVPKGSLYRRSPKLNIVLISVLYTLIGLFLLTQSTVHAEDRPVEMTFLAVDLKFSQQHGIKICEIQAASLSGFVGFDTATSQPGCFAKTFCNTLGSLQSRLWFLSEKICDAHLKKEFIERGWLPFHNMETLTQDPSFQAAIKLPFNNPSDISSYRGVVYAPKLKAKDICAFKQQFPSIILMDAVTTSVFGDKLLMSQLFDDALLTLYKPKWKSYPKRYEKGLAAQIINDIPGASIVIKPRKGSLGNGVIIIDKKELDNTLKYILTSKILKLRQNPDKSYSFWGFDKADSFIVEEFVESDPILVHDKPYDAIVRTSFLLVDSQKGVDLYFMPPVYTIPKKSLLEQGTLNEKHKSIPKGPYFFKVDDAVKELVEGELSKLLPILYRKMQKAQKSI